MGNPSRRSRMHGGRTRRCYAHAVSEFGVEDWKRLADEPELLEAAGACDSGDVRAVAWLRKRWPADRVNLALQWIEATRKAQAKFGELPPGFVADVAGVEQASSRAVAAYKASRFSRVMERRRRRERTVLDLCCGIGGDAMSFERAGLKTLGVDRDPVRAWMCRRHSGACVACADLAAVSSHGRWVHVDPSRRDASGRRRHGLSELIPGPEAVGRVVREAKGAAIKLGPGTSVEQVRDWLAAVRCSCDYVSENGRLVQLIVWTGELAEPDRTATLIRSENGAARPTVDRVISPPRVGTGEQSGADDAAEAVHVGRIGGRHGAGSRAEYEFDRPWAVASESELVSGAARGRPEAGFLFEPDAAVERAGLHLDLAEGLGLRPLAPGLGLLTGPEQAESVGLRSFEIVKSMPWRADKVSKWLRDHDAGVVEVKTRGGAVDPDVVQKRLRGEGSAAFTVFVLRLGRKKSAWITRRRGRV